MPDNAMVRRATLLVGLIALFFLAGCNPTQILLINELWGNGSASGTWTCAGGNGTFNCNLTSANGTGDITAVNAGNGLQGGGISGAVTLSTDAPTCAAGNYSYWNGSVWSCRSDSAGVTSVTAGSGLTGGIITTTGTIALNDSYVDSNWLRNDGGAATGDYSFGNVTTDLVDAVTINAAVVEVTNVTTDWLNVTTAGCINIGSAKICTNATDIALCSPGNTDGVCGQ